MNSKLVGINHVLDDKEAMTCSSAMSLKERLVPIKESIQTIQTLKPHSLLSIRGHYLSIYFIAVKK